MDEGWGRPTDAAATKAIIRASWMNQTYNMRFWRYQSETAIQSLNRWTTGIERLYNGLREDYGMPTKNYNTPGQLIWVNRDLSPIEKNNFRSWDVHDSDVWMGLASYIGAGFKVTLTKIKVTNSYTASMIGSDDVGRNKGRAVSAFASDLYVAARLLLFKVNVLLPEDWSEFSPAPSEDFG